MTPSTRRTLAAALATALSLALLLPVLHGQAWLVRGLGAVAVTAAAGTLARRWRLPLPAHPVLGMAALAVYLLLVFVPGTFDHGLPTSATLDALQRLVDQGSSDLRRYAPPLLPRAGLLLLTTAGIGAVALLVDLLAVSLDRVVLSGLPLLALLAVPSSVLSTGVGGLAFVVAAAGWLLLLLEEGGERTQEWGPLMRPTVPGAKVSADEGAQARVGRRLSAAALGVAVLVPSLVPGLQHGLDGGGGGGGTGGAAGPSSATTYNPITKLRDELALPKPKQLFVYSSDDPDPDYVRLTTLDTYTGTGWQSSELQADPDTARVQRGIPAGVGALGETRDVTTRIAVDGNNLDVHWLPLPYGPRSVSIKGSWLWDPVSETAFSASRTTQDLKPYTVRAKRPIPSREELLGAGVDYPPQVHRYLQQPAVSERVVALATRITKGAQTPYDMAMAIQDYFTSPASGFVYDLTPSEPVAGQDPLDAFLTRKHGFCQQYATAMAVLLRVSGLPARVAVGFTAGEQVDRRKHTYRVTTSDAHAWPEAYFPGTGWVRFEPTPAAPTATTPDYAVPVVPGATSGGSPTPTPSASASARPRQFKDPDQLLKPEPAGGSTGGGGVAGSGRTPWLLAGLLVVVVAAAPRTATVLRRRARARRRAPEAAWEQLRDDVRDVGRVWLDSASPRATVVGLRADLPASAAAALERLAQAVELVRYAPPGRQHPGDVVADGAVVRRSLLATAPRAVRWRARALPPSTLRWAAHGVSERVADLLDAVDHALAWLGRPVRRVLRAG